MAAMDEIVSPMSASEATARVVAAHLAQHPRDKRYVDLLLENSEFSPEDNQYPGWLRYNLGGIDSGRRLIGRIEGLTGPLRGARVLDIGAGGGGNSIALAEHGCDVMAVEIDELRLSWLRTRVADHRLPITIGHEPLELLSPSQTFDLVICNAVLEHVENWRAFLGEVLRHCPAGTLYLAWPNKFSLLEIWADQHYGLLGAVFLTGRLRWLQKPYLRLRGITRNAWVTDIPTAGTVRRFMQRRNREYTVRDLMPEGFDKIRTPEKISHTGARRAVQLLKRLRVPELLVARLIVSQKATREVLVITRPRR
jgi:2-polyprenyl-3-methyl-5-hydroxy-6-metoxy-1,4-benzoquinol methylase